MTSYLSEGLGAVSIELQTRSSHANCVGIDDGGSAVESPTDETKSSNESEKKVFSSTGHNKPPELVPYCSDMHITHPDEDSSSPPQLFPEAIMTRTKLSKSLPGKTVKNVQVISIGSSPPQNKDFMEYIEFNDSSLFECDEEYVIASELKRKINPLCKSLGLSSLKQGKWRSEAEKSIFNIFLNMKLGRTRLKERDKLKKASERMRRSPRALAPKDESTEKISSLEEECGAGVNTVGIGTFETSTDGSNTTIKCPESSSHLDREYNLTFSQEKSYMVYKESINLPLTQSTECPRMNITECIDISGESVDSFESRGVGEPGKHFFNEVAVSEPTLKDQSTEGNEGCRNYSESWFSLSSKNESTELYHNQLACNFDKDVKEDTKEVAEEICSLSKIAENHSNSSIHNKLNMEQDNVTACTKSGNDLQNSKGQSLIGVQDKLKVTQKRVVASEQTNHTCLFQKRVPSLQNYILSEEDEKQYGTRGHVGESTVNNSNKVAESSSYNCKGNMTHEAKIYSIDEIASHMLNEKLKNDAIVMQKENAKFTTSAMCESNRMKQEENLSECDLSENKTLEVKKKQQNTTLQIVDPSLLEGDKKVDSQKGGHDSLEIKSNTCEGIKEDIPKTSERGFITHSDTMKGNKREASCVMVAGSSSGNIFTDSVRKSDLHGTSKLNSSHSSEKGVNYQSEVSCARMMVDSFGRNLLAGCDIEQEPHDYVDPNVYVNQEPNNWPIVEDDEDYEDYIFTLPKRVSTGKEERDIIDGIEMLSFETEHDMVEFTKIQQDFCHGSSVDDGMIQSDDGLDMMDDTFPLCGDVDLQYIHQAIVPTKTNDITKIKGWRNKQFAVNDNPPHYCGSFSSEAYEDDDGFESCDVKITDETNAEEDQQNHWYSENTKCNNTNVCTTIKDGENRATEDKTSSGSCGKQKCNPVKDDVMLSYGNIFQPKALELLKHLQASVNETKNSKSAFVSDILDNYLSSYSQLNVSYEIPKLGAEEGITHRPEYERDKFILPSPPRHLHTVSEKLSVPRKTGPKAKTLAEKRKMLEMEMLEAESTKGRKRRRGRPRLHPRNEPEASTEFQKNVDTKKPVTAKCLSTPQKKDLEQNAFNLDPDYKYTWVGKRPIRITGSKANKELVPNDHCLSISVRTEVGEVPVHDSIASDVIQKENEAVADKKSSDETKEQNIIMNDLTTCEKLPPSPPNYSANSSEYGIVVYPCVGRPLHPLGVKQLMHMRSTEISIDRKWAKFSVAVVTSSKDVDIHDHSERHVIPVKYVPLFDDLKISPHKKDEVTQSHTENALLNIKIPKDSGSRFSSFKIIQLSPEPELSKQNTSSTTADSLVTVAEADLKATCVDTGHEKDENILSALNFLPRDDVQFEVKHILEDMIDCILIHEIEDTIIQDDPDACTEVTVTTPKCSKKDIGKYMKNKVYRELNRLDVNVIVMGEDRNGCIEKIYGGTSCEKDFCRLGCVCASLRTSKPSATLSDHCGNLECMFECSCQELSSDQSNNDCNAEKPSLLYSTAMRLQDEENIHLAKVEKEFRHTVIQSKNEVIVLRGSSCGDGGRRRREIKLPERYRDFSVVLGKEFAMTEFKMIASEDMHVTPALSSNYNTRRSERQSYLPNYAEEGVPKLASVSITKPLHRPTKRKLNRERKVSLWCEHFKVKPCSVRIERTDDLENVAPWCMVHLRYDCFCSEQSLKPSKRIPYESVERPPPVPGPPLDSTETNMDVVKHRSHISRNVAVKSTSQTYPHAHDVYRHSARTVGSTINYVLRNQSHCFQRRHERNCLQNSETECDVNSAVHSPFQITEPIKIISKFDFPPRDFMMQADSVSLDEQEVIPVNTDIGDDNEEVGFGKIVSIMSLKPEEFEKCGSEEQTLQQEADGACDMDMFLNTDGQLPGVLTAERNISEVNSNVIRVETEGHGSEKVQVCNSDERSCESEIFKKLPSVLIPVLPGSSCSINSARLAELISKKNCELKNILKNCMMPLNLSQSTAGSIQLISWNTLMNQIENRTYHLWLQYKCGPVPKLIVTGTADKPDQYCVSLGDSYFDSPPDLHYKLPPFITFLIQQLNVKDRIRCVSSEDKNCFGLLQFDGDNWELLGSLLRNVCSVDWCSNQSVQSQNAEQANHQETSDRQQQDQIHIKSQKERSEDIAEEHSYFIEQESTKIIMNTDASFNPPLINIRTHQSGINNPQESMVESSQAIEESSEEQHGRMQKNCARPDLPVKEQDLGIDGPILCESADVLVDLKKRLGTQLVQAYSLETTGAGSDLTVVDRVCNEGAIAVYNNELASDSFHNSSKTMENGVNQIYDTTDAYAAERQLVLIPESHVKRRNLSLQSNSECGSSDPKVKNSQRQPQRDDCEEISMIIVKERPHASDKTDQESSLEQSATSPAGTLSVRLSNNTCNFDRIQRSGIEVPLPTGPDPARWYMLNIKNRFDLLHLSHSKCIIRYAQLIRAVYLANSHGKTVRVPLEKRIPNTVDGKNISVLREKHPIASAILPKFGVYTVPNLYTRVFIGPYGLREDAGVGAIKIINGRLVNTMYLDPQHDSLADTDESITALLESSGEGAALNMQMERMYDSIARSPEGKRMCRGMWLYTTRSADKRNAKPSFVSIDGNREVLANTRSSTSAPVTEIGDEERNTTKDMMKSCSYLQGENCKSCSESGHTTQHFLTIDTETDSRREGSQHKQMLNVWNNAHVAMCENISVHEIPKNVRKQCDVKEGGMKRQSSKGSPLVAIAEFDPNTRDVNSDSDGDAADENTPHHAGTVMHKTKTCLLPGTKGVSSERTGKNENSSLQKHQKRTVPESMDNTAASSASVHSAGPLAKDTIKSPLLARPTYPQGSAVMSVGKTVVSLKLVPSIASVGYIKAVMYHNKSVMLKDPFSSMDEQAYFQNLETATRWLTDELRKRMMFIPEDLRLIWRIRHATVNTKACQPFDCRILDGNHVLTEKGVSVAVASSESISQESATHSGNEKKRRKGLLYSFQLLGSILMSEGQLVETNRYDILQLAIDEIRSIHATNARLQSQVEMLRKRRITNFARLYQRLKALPSTEDRKKEVAKLKKIFENYGETVPVIDLHESSSDDDKESVTKLSRKAEGTSHHAQNNQQSHAVDKASSNPSDSHDYVTDVKESEDNALKEDISKAVKPWVPHPSQPKKGVDDDSVSMSISVVLVDEPMSFTSESDDRDVVTVTRIPHGSDKEKPFQDPISSSQKSLASNAEGVIQTKATVLGEKNELGEIITVVDTPQAIPLKTNTCEKQTNHAVEMDGFLGLTCNSEKEVNDLSPEKSGTVSGFKKSSDTSMEFAGLPNMQGKIKSEIIKRKADFDDIELNEPQKPTVESVDVKDTVPVSGEKQGYADEGTNIGGTIPDLSGICYTVMPSQRKRISICVDNKSIRTCPSLGVTPAVNNETTDSVTENLQNIKFKQQRLDGNLSGNITLASNEIKLDGNPEISEVNRSVQNHVKVTNINEKDAIKKLFIDLPKVRSPSVTTMNSISTPSLKKGILQGRSSDIKYVVCDNSISKLVPATVSSGNKVGYHIVTSNRGGRSGNGLSCSNVAMKTAMRKKETFTPLYFTIVSSANVQATGSTSSISASKMNIVTAVRNSNQSTQTGPQSASGVGLSPGHTVHLLQPVTTKTVRVSGNKLISFRRKNNQYMVCSGNQLHGACLVPALVPTQKSPSPSVVTKLTNSNSNMNRDSISLLANTNLINDCPPLVERSVIKPVQSSEFSTLKLRQLPTFVPGQMGIQSSNVVSDSVCTTTDIPGLTLTTRTTPRDSTASCSLTPEVVNTTQNKPMVSLLNSNSCATAIIPKKIGSSLSSPAFIPVTAELSSSSFENVENNPAVFLRTVASNISRMKLVTTNAKSGKPKSVNISATSPTLGVSVGVLRSRIRVSSGNGVDSEESPMSQNDCVSSVRISDKKSGKDISSLKDLDEKSKDGVTTSGKKKHKADVSSIVSSNEKSQNDTASVRRRTKQKLQNNKISSTGSLNKTTHKSRVASLKQNCHTTSSPKSRSKAQVVTASTAKSRLRSNSKRKRTKFPVGKMVTRSSSRRK